MANISMWQSQQSSVVIWSVMRKSQCANHIVMEIWNICTNQLRHAGYLYIGILHKEKDRTLEIVIAVQHYRIHCNFLKIVNSLPLPHGFSKFRFSRKNLLSLPIYCIEIFNYHMIIKIHLSYGVRLTIWSIMSENLHQSVGVRIGH